MNLEFNFCDAHDWFFEGRTDEVGRKLYRCSKCGQATMTMQGIKKTIEPLIVDYDDKEDAAAVGEEIQLSVNPYESFDDNCLQELLRMNIETENYERCAEIRDELLRRQKLKQIR